MTPVDGPVDGEAAPTAKIDKALLRQVLRERRARYVSALPPSARNLSFRVLPSPVLRRLPAGATVALYYATGDEVPTENIALQLDSLGFRLALPRLEARDGMMHFAHWDLDQILVPGRFRTLQPAPDAMDVVPDVIVAPMLGFDPALGRLGQGGGYYDRVFAAYPAAMRIGLAWSAQQVDHIPMEPHDLPLHLIVTEAAILEREDAAGEI